MWKFAPYVLKNLWRHRLRTALTIAGSAVALFLFSFVGSVQQGLDSLTRQQQNERTLIVFQANKFCPFTSKLPQDYDRKILNQAGVADVVPIQLFMNNCRASLDLVVFYGMPRQKNADGSWRSKLRTARNLQIVAGNWNDFEGRQDGALVGSALARRRGLSVGQKFTVGEAIVWIAGIFRSPDPAEENYLYCHLDFLQRTRGLNSVGLVTQLEVQLKEGASADAVCQAIDTTFRGGPIQTDTRPKGVFQANAVGDLVDLIGFANYLGYACVGLVLALVATTTVMAVQDRTREHAVLQTLGFSGPRIFALVVSESLLVSLIGGVLGVVVAMATLNWSGLAIGTEGVTIAFVPSLQLAITGLAVSLGVGVLAGLVPAWQAARAEIVASLRYV
jgi:putative ABC transport system permease protein